MNRLIQGKINVSNINKDLLFKGKTGLWLDINIWIKEEPDQYGNICSIEQKTDKGAEKIYLGNGKDWKPRDTPEPATTPATTAASSAAFEGDLPF